MLVTYDEELTFLFHKYLAPDRGPPPAWLDRANVVRLLELTIKLVRAIAQVHKLGYVHSSIRPTTVSLSMFNEVHLHDFSCAFRFGLATDSHPIRERGMTEESLPYLAPECSGRVAKHADYRSDFYSIGATLFQVLTGRTPFADAIDPLELVHAHIAKRAPLAHTLDPSVPDSISQVVDKLLEKEPEARYQTAEGLVVDLETIADLLKTEIRPSTEQTISSGPPSPSGSPANDLDAAAFVVGKVDESAYFRLPPGDKMFGRAENVKELEQCYERIKATNKPEVAIITGHSGIGKTSLVESIRKPVVQAKGLYTTVKFDQITSPVPFFAITQALSGLLRQLLSESATQLRPWRRRLERALGKEGRVLADVLPTLEQIFEPGWLDQQPPVAVLGPAESEQRFQNLVQKLLRKFAKPGRPLLVTFDDLQWSTPSDLAFITSLVAAAPDENGLRTGASTSNDPILIVCLWRDNEVGPDHIVGTQLIPNLGPISLTITLQPLTLDDVVLFVTESFRRPQHDGADPSLRQLSELILAKTLGSPLFVAQLLRILNQEGYFIFDFSTGQWLYDLDAISRAPSVIMTDVVQLLEARMRKFSPQTQGALRIAACLGNQELEANVLAQAADRTLAELATDLREPIEEGLIVALGKLDDERDNEPRRGKQLLRANSGPALAQFYRFFHDRCQQAAYSLIPTEEAAKTHYLVGQRLVSHISEATLHDRIFDLVNQLNHGMESLTTVDERDKLAKYNHLAGAKANKATAFEAARNYFQIAWDLLGAGGWVGQHKLMSRVTEALVDVEFSLTDYAAAQEYVKIYLLHSKDDVGKMRVYARSIRCASAIGDSALAVKIGREGLKLAGVNLPDDPTEAGELVQQVHDQLSLTAQQVYALTDSPPLTDPILLGAQQIMAALVPPIYFTRIELLGAMSSLAAKISVKHGMCAAGAFLFTLHAVIVKAVFNEAEHSLAYGKTAVGFVEKHGGSPLSCPTYKVYASHVAVWSEPIRAVLPFFQTAVAFGIEYRDSEYVGFGAAELCSYSLLAGVNLGEVASNLERFSVLVRKFRHELSTLYIGAIHQVALNLVGRAANVGDVVGEACSQDDQLLIIEKGYAIIVNLLHMSRLMIAVFFHDANRAAQSVKIGREYMAGGQGTIYPIFFQLFEAISFYDRFGSLTDEEHAVLAETTELFDQLAGSQPTNFRALQLWLVAERHRVEGRTVDAVDAYDDAIASALESECIHYAACMNERCAKVLRTTKLGAGYLFEARNLWRKWGCQPKVAALEQEFPELLGPELVAEPRADGVPSGAGATTTPICTPPGVLNPADPLHAMNFGVHFEGQSSVGGGHDGETDRASTVHDSSTPSSHAWQVVNGGTASASGSRTMREPPSSGSHGSHSADHNEGVESLRSIAHSEMPSARSLLATELDLRTVVSASSVISMELSVDGVVTKLLSLALRTAGAELCLLVLDKNGTLCPEATVSSETSEVKYLRRTDAIDLQPERYPCSVINYVARSKAMVVNNLDVLGEVIVDPYLKIRKPKSVLCLALASQQRVVGVLWMENSLTENAFTPDRLEILSLISGQAASTIEKARLVHDLKSANADLKRSQAALETYNRNLEGTVADRTLELQHKNDLLVIEIDERERAQREMRKSKEVAESATAMKSQFLANMSHEIRTPFNAVVALAGLLLDTPLNPVQTDYVETIKNSSQELLVVINDILDYSKIELDHLELSRDKVQVRNMIESSLDMLAERAANKNVELALVLKQGDINILGDIGRLRQIVVNLLSNAVKFTSHGEIIVKAKSEPIPEKTDDGQAQCRVSISVQDSGIGIAKEHFGKLFRVYSQAEGSETAKNFGGTGLGLAISRKLSLLMGGDITVESEIGKGSTFTLSIIAPESEAPETDLYSAEQNPDLKGKRCLIVDENETSRTVLSQLISSFGLQAVAPINSNEAYAIAVDGLEKNNSFDVVIVDAFLPGFAAQVLLRRLRQKGINAPAVALTRMGSPIYEEMRQLDCKFLIKPIKRNRLHHTLRQVFPASEAANARRAATPPPAPNAFPSELGRRCPLTILCAEDNPINVKVITHLLKRMGYSCEIAENGKVAFDKAQKKRYDIIFMDVNMPVMGGLEATRRICEALPDPQVRPPIVAMTANAMAGDKEMCFKAGCDGYVSKPILVPDLVKALTDAHAKAVANRAPETEVPTPSSAGSGGMVPGLGIGGLGGSGGGAIPGLMAAGGDIELQLPVGRRLGRMSASGRSASRGGSGTSSPARSPSPSSGSSGGAGAGLPKMTIPAPVPVVKRSPSLGSNGAGAGSGVGMVPLGVTPPTPTPTPTPAKGPTTEMGSGEAGGA